jgi:mono/diheme cytochrome c family protein
VKAVLLLLWLLTPVPLVSAQQPSGPAQGALAGSMLFGSKGCVRCHAVNGVGGRTGPDLGRARDVRSFAQLGSELWNHLPTMATRMRQLEIAPPRLALWEVEDLTAFLFTAGFFGARGDPDRGARLFGAKRCIVCHQVRGTGGVVGPSLDRLSDGAPIDVAAAMWNHGPAMSRVMAARGIARPTMTGAELTDLIAYIQGTGGSPADRPLYLLAGRPAEGRLRFTDKGCVRCHVSGGGGLGPDLAGRRRDWNLLEFAAAMWNKAPKMMEAMRATGSPVPTLTSEELADLIAYLYALQYFDRAGDAVAGGRLVESKGCLDCHTRSRLARAAGLTSASAVVAAMWNHAALVPPERLRRPWPRISASELSDLVAFFTQVPRGS